MQGNKAAIDALTEWQIARSTGNPDLEHEKAAAMLRHVRQALTRQSDLEAAAEGMESALEEIRIIRRKPWTDMADDVEQRLRDTSHIVDICVGIAEKALAAWQRVKGGG